MLLGSGYTGHFCCLQPWALIQLGLMGLEVGAGD